MRMDILTPAARSRYDTYVEHLRACPECPRGAGRCTMGAQLVRRYLEAIRRR
ncbi:hypothetical protein [Streptomyces tauricus]|uniref:hypothetical protein n=1 Tax=Streptomyces tauricus TaxID=68274 RepID=UPI002243201F|nr:hypothetical protein [Streptomyces tauricus]MCW8102675.1 hypothetical protein [Streptomyces tauricus]